MLPPPEWLLKWANGEFQPQMGCCNAIPPFKVDEKHVETLNVSRECKDKILSAQAKGQRSQDTASVIASLLRAGYHEKIIFWIFEHFPIGGKFREKGSGRDKWLKDEIKRARDFLKSNPQNDSTTGDQQQPVKGKSYIELLQERTERELSARVWHDWLCTPPQMTACGGAIESLALSSESTEEHS